MTIGQYSLRRLRIGQGRSGVEALAEGELTGRPVACPRCRLHGPHRFGVTAYGLSGGL
jgi:hypothetical protein